MGEDELSASSCVPFIHEENANDSHGIQSTMTSLEMHCIFGEHTFIEWADTLLVCEADPVSMQTGAN
jgi:hypothetical protein